MSTRAEAITSEFFNTLGAIMNPANANRAIGHYQDTPDETITDTYTDTVTLNAWVGYIPVEPQTLRVTWEKSYFEYEDADDVDPEVTKVEWLANKYITNDICEHWVNVTDLLKVTMDLNELLK